MDVQDVCLQGLQKPPGNSSNSPVACTKQGQAGGGCSDGMLQEVCAVQKLVGDEQPMRLCMDGDETRWSMAGELRQEFDAAE